MPTRRRDPVLLSRARQLRGALTPAERILWAQLRDRRFADFKFRRQHLIGSFVLDFYCAGARLAIELDGETHLGRQNQDANRTNWLEQQGVEVLRFWNSQVFDELESILQVIWQECRSRGARPNPSPQPSPQRGEGEE